MDYLKIENLSKFYNKSLVFKGVNINLKKGEICCILGKSGVGKTTLFNILAGFEKQDEGEIIFKGKCLSNNNFSSNIAYMQQKSLLLPHMTIFQNICLPMKIKKVCKKDMFLKAEKVLKHFNLWDIKDKFPNEISGGMAQRIAFIRAYLQTKELFLLDEPFSSLDYITSLEIYDWFYKIIKEEKITVLLVTHNIQEAILLSDKIYIIEKNFDNTKTIIIDDKPKELKSFINSQNFFNLYKKILELFC